MRVLRTDGVRVLQWRLSISHLAPASRSCVRCAEDRVDVMMPVLLCAREEEEESLKPKR